MPYATNLGLVQASPGFLKKRVFRKSFGSFLKWGSGTSGDRCVRGIAALLESQKVGAANHPFVHEKCPVSGSYRSAGSDRSDPTPSSSHPRRTVPDERPAPPGGTKDYRIEELTSDRRQLLSLAPLIRLTLQNSQSEPKTGDTEPSILVVDFRAKAFIEVGAGRADRPPKRASQKQVRKSAYFFGRFKYVYSHSSPGEPLRRSRSRKKNDYVLRSS